MATHEFILKFLVLYSSTAWLVPAQTVRMYERTLPSGRTVQCNLCPPGFRRQKHCTETQPTKCQPCSVGFYSEQWNYMNDCLPCNVCSSDKIVIQECTSTTKLVCQCKEGFYSHMDFCWQHTVCPAGSGVKEKGTKDKDTVCEPCGKGYYSSGEPGHSQCVPHTRCTSEERLLFHSTNYLDNVCVTCDSIRKNGWVKFITPSFIEMFKHHNSRKARWSLRHLDGVLSSSNPNSTEGLQQWFNQATKEQVRSLPENLHPRSLANKIKHRIQRVEDGVSLCTNTVHNHLK